MKTDSMKRILSSILAISLCLSLGAQEKIRLMPAWTPQAQFAGYYVAKDMGFYAEQGLDVDIQHIGVNSSKSGVSRIAEGEVDLIISNPIQALLARENGTGLVNVLQVNQSTGMMIVSHNPISGPQDLNGLKVGRWKSGFTEICLMWGKANDLHVEWIPFLNGINAFISGALDATVVMSYNEYYQLVEAMGEIPEENCIHFSDCGYDIPEDGVYATEEYVASHREAVDKFCEATKKGWDWCLEHREEAVDIVLAHMKECKLRSSRYHQTLMLDGILDLLYDKNLGMVSYEQISPDLFRHLVRELTQMGILSGEVSYGEFFK